MNDDILNFHTIDGSIQISQAERNIFWHGTITPKQCGHASHSFLFLLSEIAFVCGGIFEAIQINSTSNIWVNDDKNKS